MKKMIFAAAFLAIASPAFAQSYDPSVGSGNLVGPVAAAHTTHAAPRVYLGAESAYTRVIPGSRHHRAGAPAAAFAGPLYDQSGHAVGTDPDPNIRFQLRREADSIEGF